MTDWQVTATTIFCDAVVDEVTIIVKNDWSVKCTGLLKYTNNRHAGVELVKRSLELKRVLECKGIDCSRISDYINKLKAEEDVKAKRAGDNK